MGFVTEGSSMPASDVIGFSEAISLFLFHLFERVLDL